MFLKKYFIIVSQLVEMEVEALHNLNDLVHQISDMARICMMV